MKKLFKGKVLKFLKNVGMATLENIPAVGPAINNVINDNETQRGVVHWEKLIYQLAIGGLALYFMAKGMISEDILKLVFKSF